MNGLEKVKKQPKRKEIKYRKVRSIGCFLDNIHRFTTVETNWSVSEKAVWRGHVDEHFAQHLGRNYADLGKYLGGASFPQFFGSFVNAVVIVHRRHCDKCEFQRNAWERVEQWRPKLQEIVPTKIYLKWILHKIQILETEKAISCASSRLSSWRRLLDELFPQRVGRNTLVLLQDPHVFRRVCPSHLIMNVHWRS